MNFARNIPFDFIDTDKILTRSMERVPLYILEFTEDAPNLFALSVKQTAFLEVQFFTVLF